MYVCLYMCVCVCIYVWMCVCLVCHRRPKWWEGESSRWGAGRWWHHWSEVRRSRPSRHSRRFRSRFQGTWDENLPSEYMYQCINVCVHVCLFVGVHMYMHVWHCMCMYAFKRTFMYICMYIYIYICVCECVCVCVRAYVAMCVSIYYVCWEVLKKRCCQNTLPAWLASNGGSHCCPKLESNVAFDNNNTNYL